MKERKNLSKTQKVELGKRIKWNRRSKRVKGSRIQSELQVSRELLKRIESGDPKVTSRIYTGVADYLGIKLIARKPKKVILINNLPLKPVAKVRRSIEKVNGRSSLRKERIKKVKMEKHEVNTNPTFYVPKHIINSSVSDWAHNKIGDMKDFGDEILSDANMIEKTPSDKVLERHRVEDKDLPNIVIHPPLLTPFASVLLVILITLIIVIVTINLLRA